MPTVALVAIIMAVLAQQFIPIQQGPTGHHSAREFFQKPDGAQPSMSESALKDDGLLIVDVPAIVGKDWQQMYGNADYSNPHEEWKTVDHWGYMRWWTCEDKARILMVSEDGTRHCLKFKVN